MQTELNLVAFNYAKSLGKNINESNLNSISEIQTTRYCEIVRNLHPNILVHPTNHKIPDILLNLYNELDTEINTDNRKN